jgi:hypothetical protein
MFKRAVAVLVVSVALGVSPLAQALAETTLRF